MIEIVKKFHILLLIAMMVYNQAAAQTSKETNDKLVIYQLLPRYFGNKKTANIPYGTIEQNGSGKFNDITDKALDGLKELKVQYIWYTGVLAHASLTDYSRYGIKADHPFVVKGRAGSPYAIRDYYDVDPDLATNVPNRLLEFKSLIARTHAKNMKVLIDFVPNHVARGYHSYAKPKAVENFGVNDRKNLTFHPKNDFYYIPNQSLQPPIIKTEKDRPADLTTDLNYVEYPAKATGNNVFSATPSASDWYETVKLNYGIEYRDGKELKHFTPIPPVWSKMRDILIYWSKMGVDGFRCDVAEMVPVEFWEWVIPQVKKAEPGIIFIAEAYNPTAYEKYLNQGKFDYLYDKVGLYDALKRLIKDDPQANVEDVTRVWQIESGNFGNKMLRFMENHDEERIASNAFAGDPERGIPAMVIAATLGKGPVMIYYGQEVGENAGMNEGYLGDDVKLGRTTIFDYWGVPQHQKWMNNGLFNGGKLDDQEKKLRNTYKNLMTISQKDAIAKGEIKKINQPEMNNKMYAYIRFTKAQRLLIITNFDRKKTLNCRIRIPSDVLSTPLQPRVKELLENKNIDIQDSHFIPISLAPGKAQIIQF